MIHWEKKNLRIVRELKKSDQPKTEEQEQFEKARKKRWKKTAPHSRCGCGAGCRCLSPDQSADVYQRKGLLIPIRSAGLRAARMSSLRTVF